MEANFFSERTRGARFPVAGRSTLEDGKQALFAKILKNVMFDYALPLDTRISLRVKLQESAGKHRTVGNSPLFDDPISL